ncbi:hypothetical protein JB92DRAFT_176276 [Gautieria morchelliformis]|nr:hypothetical protein JB92DRAFT_176276 [Gautieria morchelliformis]
MSPFKVVRCRYYADDGKAIPPYCAAGRRCTFLHPGDKGWPGGDPVPEISKRQPDERDQSSEYWPRLRALKSSDRSNPQPKASMSRSNATASITDIVRGISTPHTCREDTHTSNNRQPVFSIVNTFHDIAKLQAKITQDKEKLDQAIDKLATFQELSHSLSKVSMASAAAVNPTLDAITKSRHELEEILDEDTRQLSDLWDDVFKVFLRAVCRQFNSELEASTEFLRKEARKLMDSFPKKPDSSSPNNPPPSRTCDSLTVGGSDQRLNTAKNTSDTNSTFKGEEEPVNPPIGLSDNGWGRRKRRRVSSESAEDDTECADGAAHLNLRDIVAKMQQQLDEQGDRIRSLTEQNHTLRQANYSNTNQAAVRNGTQSLPSSPPQGISPQFTSDLFPHIRRTLQSDILTFLSPALENQKQVNKYWEMRLNALEEELRNINLINSRNGLEESVEMEAK